MMRYLPTFNDMFNNFFEDNYTPIKKMATDIKENDTEYTLEMDVPGINKEDIKISLDKGYMTVSATYNNEKEETNDHVIRTERYRGEMKRSFYVGDSLKEEDITAHFNNGELTITIPKEVEKRSEEKKYIEIQ